MPRSGRVEPDRRIVVDSELLGSRANTFARKGFAMTAPTTFSTPYQRRLELISDTIQTNAKLNAAASDELAVHVLRALNSIPEKIR